MQTRILQSDASGAVSIVDTVAAEPVHEGWVWVDITAGRSDIDDLVAFTTELSFDAMAVRDAVDDLDYPKVDDFGHHLLVILHGLRDDRVETYEVDCFITKQHLVTVHHGPSPALDLLWARVQDSPGLARGGVDELLARLADVLTRRLLAVLDAFDDKADEMIDRAHAADTGLLTELTAVRRDLSAVRRVVHPQREVLDSLRHSASPLVSDSGRRRFSDVFDVAARTGQGLDAARIALAEILDAYRGAEARQATDVTMVLTIYAAIMLPLALVVGFFGMNFSNIPGLESDWGWIVVTAIMIVITAVSLGIFVTVGWIRRPSGRRAGATLGRGLTEAARAPAQVVGALYEISTMPLRATTRRSKSSTPPE